jgi:hypothetical protein
VTEGNTHDRFRRSMVCFMLDSIATFPLRTASTDELGVSLGRCYAEYNAWHGQACFIANFANDARVAGVHSVVAGRVTESLDFGEATGVFVGTAAKTKSSAEIAQELAMHQLLAADVGVKIAAIVMLHNACERLIWRLLRFGIVANRTQLVDRIAERKVTVQMLVEQDRETLIDGQLEKWWETLERDSLMKKWDCLVDLFGTPSKLRDGTWHFDRKMLARFDEVRHNAVHHDGQAVRNFDFNEFSSQLLRAQWVWLVEVSQCLSLKIPADSLFRVLT